MAPADIAWQCLSKSLSCILLIHLVSSSEGHLKLRKCCPRQQLLFLDSSDHMECMNVTHGFTEPTNNETKDANNRSDTVWWIPDSLKLIETLRETDNMESDVNIIDDLKLTGHDFVFDQKIPCFDHNPEVLLVQSNVFLDVNRSQLVLTEKETVPEYTAESAGDIDEIVVDENRKTTKRESAKVEREQRVGGKTLASNDEKIGKNDTIMDDVDVGRGLRSRGTAEQVDIVRDKLRGDTKIKVNARFPSDVFCIDRVAFPTNDVEVEGLTNSLEIHSNRTSLDLEDEISSSDWNYVILLCPCQSDNTVCVRKCCGENKLLHVSDSDDRSANCIDHAPRQNAKFEVDIFSANHEPPQSLHSLHHFVLHGTPHCQHGSYLLRTTTDRTSVSDGNSNLTMEKTSNRSSFKILRNSSVLLTGSRALVQSSEYCVDSIVYGASRLRIDDNILLCRLAEHRVDRTRRTIYSVCFIVGTGFLVLTLAVYSMLPELRKSVHSWNIMAHIACSIVAYTAIVIANLYTIAYPTLCILMAYILQISFLSSQLWLNAMCIDIAFTFSGLRAPAGRHFSSVDRRKFLYYSAYTWGTTAVISALTYAADTSGILAGNSPLKPNFGVKACWFKESSSIAVFFYGPIGLVLAANLVLFHYTCWKIRAAQKDTAITSAHRHVGGRTEDQTQVTTFIKLFLLMGVTWTFEIVSWVLGGPHYLWYLTDLLNVLRGVFIFIILCCKRNVLALMHKRIRKGQRRIGVSGPRPRTESNTSRRTYRSSASASTEHIPISKLYLSSNQNLSTIYQGRVFEGEEELEGMESGRAPPLSVLHEAGEESEGVESGVAPSLSVLHEAGEESSVLHEAGEEPTGVESSVAPPLSVLHEAGEEREGKG